MSQLAKQLTVADVAPMLRKTPWFVRGECRAGHLRASMVGGTWLITEADVDAYLAERTNRAETTPARRRKKRRP